MNVHEEAPHEEAGCIEVRQSVLDDIFAHARAEAPNECCGLLIGSGERVEIAVRARNLLDSPTRYEIDPVDHFAAIRSARESGRAVLGFYHSHPATSPVPSQADRDEAAYPGCCYVIVFPGSRVVPARVRAFRLQQSGNFLPVRIVPFR